MAPWGFLVTAAVCAVFPQHRGIVLVASAVGSLVQGARKERKRRGRVAQSYEGGKGSNQVTLEWGQLTCTLVDKKTGNTNKVLLDELQGKASPGRLLAIMGPSGSGKTTLLNALAGQLSAAASSAGRPELRGWATVNRVPAEQSHHRQAYVMQEDMFFSHLTVEETLTFAAKLQLPGDMGEAEKERVVEQLLGTMGLAKVRSTVVGNAKVRGISGGERKRLAVACELLGDPSLIFADEPTTGLDAFQAEKVMTALRSLAHDSGKTVICSIHQPRGSVFDMFDDLIVLAEGKLVYSGPAGDEALAHFEGAGFPCPVHSNPAEFVSDLVGIDHSSPDTEAESLARLASLVKAFQARSSARLEQQLAEGTRMEEAGEAERGDVELGGRRKGIGPWLMLKLLFSRAWKQAVRDKQTNFVRATMNFTSALIFGSIFWRMGLTQTSIQDRMGLLQVAAINTAMASLTKTLNVFPKERSIVQKELTKGAYSTPAYFFSKLAAELPIGAVFPAIFGCVMYPMTGLHKSLSRFGRFLALTTVESFTASAMGLTVGCLAPSTEAAMALGPSIMTVFIVFGGYYVNADNTPWLFRWIPNVSLIRWAFQGLSINEFKGLTFECSQPQDLRTGEQVLQRLSFEGTPGKPGEAQGSADRGMGEAIKREVGIMGFWYWASLYLLQRRQPRYVPLLLPMPLPHSDVSSAA